MEKNLDFIDYRTGSGLVLGTPIDTIMETANAINALMLINPVFIEYFGDRGKAGAVLRITDIIAPQRPTTQLLRPFGFVPFESRPKYERVSLRKVHQLIQHPDHISSHQSRDEVDFWGGGYRIPEIQFAITISGHPEKGDEVIGVCLGLELNWINLEYAKEIIKLSYNFLFKALCPLLPKFNV